MNKYESIFQMYLYYYENIHNQLFWHFFQIIYKQIKKDEKQIPCNIYNNIGIKEMENLINFKWNEYINTTIYKKESKIWQKLINNECENNTYKFSFEKETYIQKRCVGCQLLLHPRDAIKNGICERPSLTQPGWLCDGDGVDADDWEKGKLLWQGLGPPKLLIKNEINFIINSILNNIIDNYMISNDFK